jgi:hypothetical protein
MPIRCGRCHKEFDTKESLYEHSQQTIGCARTDPPLIDAFNETQETQLKKKGRPSEDEVARWRIVYRILFPVDPEESIPDAYCCVRSTDESHLRQLKEDDLVKYEAYQTRELPRVVRQRVDQLFRANAIELEEHLRNQVVEIVRLSHKEIFRSYLSSEVGVRLARPGSVEPELGQSSTSPVLDATGEDFDDKMSPTLLTLGSDDASLTESVFDSYSTGMAPVIPFDHGGSNINNSLSGDWIFASMQESELFGMSSGDLCQQEYNDNVHTSADV